MQRYTYVWEFHVHADAIEEFELYYGSAGAWVELFRRSGGYIETLLLKDRAVSGRYFTIDRWESEEAYRTFRMQFSQQYAELDELCDGFTVSETSLGVFSE